MQKHVRKFVEIAVETLATREPIYEFGAMQVHADTPEADLRSLFAHREFVGCDFRSGPGVDKVLNLHEIELTDATIGTLICLDTLEPVEYPRPAS